MWYDLGIMTNQEIAKILQEMAAFYEMKNVAFKPRAYEKAAESIENLDQEVAQILKEQGEKGLRKIPGVGPGISEHLADLVTTGKLASYDKLRKELPVNVSELLSVPGIGPKTVLHLYKKLKIRNRKDLAAAAAKHALSKRGGFSEHTEQKILDALKIEKPKSERYIRGYYYGLAKRIENTLKDSGLFEQIEIGGSFRRGEETIGDLDILGAARNPAKAMKFFTQISDAADVVEQGKDKAEIRLSSGMHVELRLVPDASWGAALIYFTGDLPHNIALRKLAIAKGLKLSEYGLFQAKNSKRKAKSETEEQVYNALGMDWIPPEIRTDTGEIELAQTHRLPDLLPYGSVLGDLQIQTDWSEGISTIAEMAEAARKLGREYIAITDHTQSLKIANGLDEKRLLAQIVEIDKLNKKLRGFKILTGAEVNILKDGSLDIEDKVLAKLDVVGVSIHSYMKMERDDMTRRLKRALVNPNVDIFFHPTTRLINRRPPIDFDFSEILKVAKKNRVAMEINGYPERTDLRDTLVRQTVEAGVKLTINSDAHNTSHLDFIKFGEATARRGWATAADVLNTRKVGDFLKALK